MYKIISHRSNQTSPLHHTKKSEYKTDELENSFKFLFECAISFGEGETDTLFTPEQTQIIANLFKWNPANKTEEVEDPPIDDRSPKEQLETTKEDIISSFQEKLLNTEAEESITEGLNGVSELEEPVFTNELTEREKHENLLKIFDNFSTNEDLRVNHEEFVEAVVKFKTLLSSKLTEQQKKALTNLGIALVSTAIGYPSVQNMILGTPTTFQQTVKNYATILSKSPFQGFPKYFLGSGLGTAAIIFVGLECNDYFKGKVKELLPTLNSSAQDKLADMITAVVASSAGILPATMARNHRIAVAFDKLGTMNFKKYFSGWFSGLIRDTFMSLMFLEPSLSRSSLMALATCPLNTRSQDAAYRAILGKKNPASELPGKLKWTVNRPLSITAIFKGSRLTTKLNAKLPESHQLNKRQVINLVNNLKKAKYIINSTRTAAFSGFYARILHLSIAVSTVSILKYNFSTDANPKNNKVLALQKSINDMLEKANKALERNIDLCNKLGHASLGGTDQDAITPEELQEANESAIKFAKTNTQTLAELIKEIPNVIESSLHISKETQEATAGVICEVTKLGIGGVLACAATPTVFETSSSETQPKKGHSTSKTNDKPPSTKKATTPNTIKTSPSSTQVTRSMNLTQRASKVLRVVPKNPAIAVGITAGVAGIAIGSSVISRMHSQLDNAPTQKLPSEQYFDKWSHLSDFPS